MADEVKQTDESLLETFLKALTEKYNGDPLSSGLVLAYLPEKKEYYASVARYTDRTNHNKQVVTKATGVTPGAAIRALMVNWHDIIRPKTSNLDKFLDNFTAIEAGRLLEG